MSEKILVVDEQLFMLRLIQHHLEKAGYEFIKARNDKEARAAMEQEKPKLVVADAKAEAQLQLALNELQVKEKMSPIPMIRVTDVPLSMEPAAAENESTVVFRKPFSPTKLMAEVKRLVPQPSAGGV